MIRLLRKTRYLAGVLALAVMLVAGASVTLASGGDDDRSEPMMGANGMGSMGSMMGGGGMDPAAKGSRAEPMMDRGMMGSERMSSSFSSNKPFDLQFIDQMTMHHRGAIMSSEHMISDSKRPELRELADDIEESQSEQIEQMQAWREEWYPDAEQTSGMSSAMMNDGMMEQMMGGSMQGMMGRDATDEMFLRMMIPHHRMAVDMSEKALERGEHPALRELARKIRDEQSAEIELMEGYLKEIEASEKD